MLLAEELFAHSCNGIFKVCERASKKYKPWTTVAHVKHLEVK